MFKLSSSVFSSSYSFQSSVSLVFQNITPAQVCQLLLRENFVLAIFQLSVLFNYVRHNLALVLSSDQEKNYVLFGRHHWKIFKRINCLLNHQFVSSYCRLANFDWNVFSGWQVSFCICWTRLPTTKLRK